MNDLQDEISAMIDVNGLANFVGAMDKHLRTVRFAKPNDQALADNLSEVIGHFLQYVE